MLLAERAFCGDGQRPPVIAGFPDPLRVAFLAEALMALTTCRECGRAGVSSDWRAICPGCGTPNPGGRQSMNQRLLVLGLAGVLILFGGVAVFLVAHR